MNSATQLKNRLKLKQLQLMAVLGEVDSLHKAADRLGVTQPNATRMLRELEETVGSPLFERSSRGMRPTEVGHLLIRHSTMLMADLDQVFLETKALRNGQAGAIRVGVFPGASPEVLPMAIQRLKDSSPDLKVHVKEGSQDVLLSALRDGSLHLVIGRAPGPNEATEFACEALLQEHFSVVCRKEHLLCERTHASLRSLASCKWILPSFASPLRGTFEVQFYGECGHPPHIYVDMTSAGVSLAMLWESDCVALIPRSTALYYERRGTLHTVLPSVANMRSPIMMISRLESVAHPATNMLMDIFRNEAKRLMHLGDPNH